MAVTDNMQRFLQRGLFLDLPWFAENYITADIRDFVLPNSFSSLTDVRKQEYADQINLKIEQAMTVLNSEEVCSISITLRDTSVRIYAICFPSYDSPVTQTDQ